MNITKPLTVNMPMRFPGTPYQAGKNKMTHDFHEGHCSKCDCRPGGRVAEWPCGQEPPRVNEAPSIML